MRFQVELLGRSIFQKAPVLPLTYLSGISGRESLGMRDAATGLQRGKNAGPMCIASGGLKVISIPGKEVPTETCPAPGSPQACQSISFPAVMGGWGGGSQGSKNLCLKRPLRSPKVGISCRGLSTLRDDEMYPPSPNIPKHPQTSRSNPCSQPWKLLSRDGWM